MKDQVDSNHHINTKGMQYIVKHCMGEGAYCHSGHAFGKDLGESGSFDVLSAGAIHLCLLNTDEEAFYQFAKLYRKVCLNSSLQKPLNPRICSVTLLSSKQMKTFDGLKDKVSKCVKEAVNFDLSVKKLNKNIFHADISVFDEQEWYYPTGSPLIIPALFINGFRINVSSTPKFIISNSI
jgi:hypothetical protein